MRRRLLASVFLLATVAACRGQHEVQSGEHTIYVHGRSSGDALDAIVAGALGVRDGCVVLEQGDAWTPVVWPAGTTIASADPLVIRLRSGVEVAVGDEVSGGGGYLGPEHVEVDIPSACLPPTREVAVFNAGARLNAG